CLTRLEPQSAARTRTALPHSKAGSRTPQRQGSGRMTVCITPNVLDFRSIYPVLDPRRTAGPGPHACGTVLCWDFLEIDVVRNTGLSSCQMTVNFTSTLSEGKEIQAWNLFKNDFVDRIGSSSLGLPASMQIQKASSGSLACDLGADTVILCRYFAW